MPEYDLTEQPQKYLQIATRLVGSTESSYEIAEGIGLNCIHGYDPEREYSTSGWTCFIINQDLPSGIELFTKDGTRIIDNLPTAISTTDIGYIKVQNKILKLSRDAWGNPCSYNLDDQDKRLTLSGFKSTLMQVIQIWESACLDDSKLEEKAKDILEQESYEYIDAILDKLEEYPEIQDLAEWTSNIDLWDIAYEAHSISESIEALASQVNPDFLTTNAFYNSLSILEKIRGNQYLSREERIFIDTFNYTTISTVKDLRNPSKLRLNPFTRRFAKARIIENFLCRGLMGWDIFSQHQDNFHGLSQILGEEGYTLPSWFTPYNGTEFLWGISIDDVIAQANGRYFIEPRQTKDFTKTVLTHERVHRLFTIAKERGRRKRYQKDKRGRTFSQEIFDESYTQSLTLLIGTLGDCQVALEQNMRSSTSYKTGTEELLRIINEINIHASNPTKGIKLMIDGLIAISEGETLQPTSKIRDYYNENIAINPYGFDSRMALFNDKNLMYSDWKAEKRSTAKSKILALTIRKALQSFLFTSLSHRTQMKYKFKPDLFEKDLPNIEKLFTLNPFNLLGLHPGPFEDHILMEVKNNPEASLELTSLMQDYYMQYTQSLRELYESGCKQDYT